MLAQILLDDLDAFLVELNRASARAILPLFRADHGLEDKGGEAGFDPVTAADKGAESAIRALISRRYPDHGVIGEEHGEDRPGADFVWVIDPIDGTRGFIAGLPLWTTLIGLRHEGRPVLGSIGQPFLGEIFIGSAAGSRLIANDGEQPLRTRAGVPLSQAIIATTDPEGCFDREEMTAWRALRRASRLARLGCDAYAYAMVAAGRLDLVVEAGLKCWDIDAAIPVIAGAGGLVTDWAGGPVGQRGGQVVLAGDRSLLEAALAAMSAS
ncbi:MAG TPA: histidinol-phosphatase [Caulobacteraceae bacterium]|nr:histidinol-phosphatase [Caulobacteraceae bacterium]